MYSSVNWSLAAVRIVVYIRAAAGTVGITGFGVAFVKFLRHAPAPRKNSVWAGCIFDTLQDLVSNETRIGERRGEDGETLVCQPRHLQPPQ
jgi:hypothetical protein